MICQDFLPHPSLRPFVRFYHLRHFNFSKDCPAAVKPYAPRPEQTLAFFPRGNESVQFLGSGQIVSRPRSAVLGQYTQWTNRLLIGEEFCALLIDFQPGMLYRFTGLPYDELTDKFVDAEAIMITSIWPKILGSWLAFRPLPIYQRKDLRLSVNSAYWALA